MIQVFLTTIAIKGFTMFTKHFFVESKPEMYWVFYVLVNCSVLSGSVNNEQLQFKLEGRGVAHSEDVPRQ